MAEALRPRTFIRATLEKPLSAACGSALQDMMAQQELPGIDRKWIEKPIHCIAERGINTSRGQHHVTVIILTYDLTVFSGNVGKR